MLSRIFIDRDSRMTAFVYLMISFNDDLITIFSVSLFIFISECSINTESSGVIMEVAFLFFISNAPLIIVHSSIVNGPCFSSLWIITNSFSSDLSKYSECEFPNTRSNNLLSGQAIIKSSTINTFTNHAVYAPIGKANRLQSACGITLNYD